MSDWRVFKNDSAHTELGLVSATHLKQRVYHFFHEFPFSTTLPQFLSTAIAAE
jgi:hypothetical protein